jgi:hypothetical protein
MKTAIKVLTTAIAVASAAFSGAAGANVIDIDIDVNTTLYQGGSWEWSQTYYSADAFAHEVPPGSNYLSEDLILPELDNRSEVYFRSWGDAIDRFSHMELFVSVPNKWDTAASWMEFDDGSRVSFQTLAGDGGNYNFFYVHTEDEGGYGIWNWEWDPERDYGEYLYQFPVGATMARDAKPTHIQLVLEPLVTPVAPLPPFRWSTNIPEPETYVMLLAGLGLVGAAARRRRNLDRR